MGQTEKITLIERDDLGPVLARADHRDNAIEVNGKVFYGLPPMVQEFVLCHEVCHLRHDEWDEDRTNQLASQLFIDRAQGDADREEREKFLSYLDGNGGWSNFDWISLSAGVASLGINLYGIIRDRNSGWYKWDRATQESNLKTMLGHAFDESRKTNQNSAAQLFWRQLQPYDGKDDSLDEFLSRSENEWVRAYIAKYEQAYGFGFDQVTPIDLTAFPLALVAIGAVVGFIVYKIIKKSRK